MKSAKVFALLLVITLLSVHQVGVVYADDQPVEYPAADIQALQPPDFSCDEVTEISHAECEALVALYNHTGGLKGPNGRGEGWLSTNTPCNWHGVMCDVKLNSYQVDVGSDYTYGVVPVTSQSSLKSVTVLDLEGKQLSGSIPPELGDLASLQVLVLNSNKFSGSIPPELGNLTNLQILGLHANKLTGSIPPELSKLKHLEILDAYLNQLSGKITPELGDLPQLKMLDLRLNKFSGDIPPGLGRLTNMIALLLSFNELKGGVPAELGNMTKMRFFQVDNNPLNGPLPLSLSNLTKLEWFDSTNTYLCELPNSTIRGRSTSIPVCDVPVPAGLPETGDETNWAGLSLVLIGLGTLFVFLGFSNLAQRRR
jgi:hypothetical protein